MEVIMLQRGDIVVERLTNRRAIVIQVDGEAITCRFPDGRLEDRFDFEVEPAHGILESLLAVVMSLFAIRPPERPRHPSASASGRCWCARSAPRRRTFAAPGTAGQSHR